MVEEDNIEHIPPRNTVPGIKHKKRKIKGHPHLSKLRKGLRMRMAQAYQPAIRG
jgi:hypothetical protein